ncbi:MAG: RNA methyltransferase [Rhodothermales bacterium]
MQLTERRRKEIARLSRKKHRDETGECILEGFRSVDAAIDAGADIRDILVAESVEVPARLMRRAPVPITRTDERTLMKLTETTTSPGVLAVVGIPVFGLDGLADARRILVLDSVQDPGNVGTLVRTAAWFGVDAVVAGPGTADFWSPKTLRATMGGVWDVPLLVVDDLAETLRGLGMPVFVADMDGTPVRSWAAPERSVLVLGSEAHGVSAAVRALSHGSVSIPMGGRQSEPETGHGRTSGRGVESLNVAVAGGILIAAWS